MENVTTAAEPAYPLSVDCAIHGPWVAQNRSQHRFGDCPECQKEWQEKEEREGALKLVEDRVNDADIPLRFRGKTLESYKIKYPGQDKVLGVVRNYTLNFPEHHKAGRCLTLIGSTGTGKTLLGCIVIQSLIGIYFFTGDKEHPGRSYRSKYVLASQLIRDVRDAWGSKTTNHYGDRITATTVMEKFARFDLLVIDEIGAVGATGSEPSEVIDQRYANVRPTVVISNCDPEEFKLALGEKTYDRLRENGGLMCPCNWPSWRGERSSDERNSR